MEYRGIEIEEYRNTENGNPIYLISEGQYPQKIYIRLEDAKKACDEIFVERDAEDFVKIREYMESIMNDDDLRERAIEGEIGKITVSVDGIKATSDGWYAAVVNAMFTFLDDAISEMIA